MESAESSATAKYSLPDHHLSSHSGFAARAGNDPCSRRSGAGNNYPDWPGMARTAPTEIPPSISRVWPVT